jgi:hypothetical protein
MPVRAVDDKASDTLVVVFGKGFWTGSSTLPHLHQLITCARFADRALLPLACKLGAISCHGLTGREG